MIRSFFPLAAALALSVAVAAVSPDTLIVHISASTTALKLDPALSAWSPGRMAVENLYEPLVGYRGSGFGAPVPVLATAWTVSPDGRTYRFALRPGVQFHSGNPLTCADAEYTLRRNLVTNHPESANYLLSESLLGTDVNATWASIAAAVRCEGPVLVLDLPRPDATLLSRLTNAEQGIVDSVHARRVGEWDGREGSWKNWVGRDLTGGGLDRQPSGTGAYRLTGREANGLTFTAFPAYWGGVPPLKTIVLRITPEEAIRVEALLRGDADVIQVSASTALSHLRGQPGVTVLDGLPTLTSAHLAMNQKIVGAALGSGKLDGQGVPADFFSDLNVRLGFVHAFDASDYIRAATAGGAQPRQSLLAETFLSEPPSAKASSPDLETARRHFQQAWGGQLWERGFTLIVPYRETSGTNRTLVEGLKRNIEALNPKFRLILKPSTLADFSRRRQQGELPLTYGSWGADYPDPYDILRQVYLQSGYYYPGFNASDPQLSVWLEELRMSSDAARRAELVGLIVNRSRELAWLIPLPVSPALRAFRSEVRGITPETENPAREFPTGTLWRELSKP